MTEQELNAVTQELANLRTVIADAIANRCVAHVLAQVALQKQIEGLRDEVQGLRAKAPAKR